MGCTPMKQDLVRICLIMLYTGMCACKLLSHVLLQLSISYQNTFFATYVCDDEEDDGVGIDIEENDSS